MNTYIKNTSRKNQRIARAAAEYAYSGKSWKNYHDIFEAYKNPSVYKVRAFEYCKELCGKLHGYDLIISAAGCQTFSVCFKFRERGTGRPCYAYITRDYDRFCYADEKPAA